MHIRKALCEQHVVAAFNLDWLSRNCLYQMRLRST
jgi:hypothetical protein